MSAAAARRPGLRSIRRQTNPTIVKMTCILSNSDAGSTARIGPRWDVGGQVLGHAPTSAIPKMRCSIRTRHMPVNTTRLIQPNQVANVDG